ncbi:MAG: S41 family peptidase [Candidatus Cyclobacteriaceae bacterium M3_2C_046]
MKKNICYWLILLISFALITQSCKEDQEEEIIPQPDYSAVNQEIYKIFKEWYLWNDQLPQLDPADEPDPFQLLQKLRYDDLDRWSFIMDADEYNAFFNEGKFVGHGFRMKMDSKNQIRISMVYQSTIAYQEGLRRGDILKAINGKNAVTLLEQDQLFEELGDESEGVVNKFSIEKSDGLTVEYELAKEEVKMNTVLHKDILDVAGLKVGYLVFNSFTSTSKAELDEAFKYFKLNAVDDLILDLRYNGGGSLGVTIHLSSLLGFKKAGVDEMAQISYNEDKTSLNESIYFQAKALGLDLDRLFVITTGATASASEVVINSLEPYLDVITFGSKTSGKPVGMRVWQTDGFAIAPITFKIVNKLGQADYFNGIPVDVAVNDDLTRDFGHLEEESLNAVISYLLDQPARIKPVQVPPVKQIEYEGFRKLVGAI